MKAFLTITIVALACTISTPAIHAANTPALKACTVAWPPYTIVGNSKEISGIDPDTIKELTKRMGHDVKISIVPWERCLKLSSTGDVDIVFVGSKKPEREQSNYYLETPMHKITYVPVIKAGTPHKWSTDMDYSSLPQPIGVPLGFSVAKQIKNVKLDQGAIDDKQNCEKLKAGRVATVVMTPEAAKYYANAIRMDGEISLLDPPVDSEKLYYIMVSKKSKNLPNPKQFASAANKTLVAMYQDGTIGSIASKYTGQ